MASHGVRTLYIETANYHNPASASMFKPAAVAVFIQQCHARKIKIVAWYLPGFKDLAKDYRRSMAAIDFRTSDGQKFDSFALDIEDSIVKPASTRSARLKTLSAKIRKAVGRRYPLGGIIPSPVGMKINSSYWPDFPYKNVAAVYDVIVPMGYYTYHGDGYAHAYNETRENVRIVREQTGRPTIPIHVIAGDASKVVGQRDVWATCAPCARRGASAAACTTGRPPNDADWRPLANVRFNKVQTPALPRDVGYAAPARQLPRRHLASQRGLLSGGRSRAASGSCTSASGTCRPTRSGSLVNWQDGGALDAGPKSKMERRAVHRHPREHAQRQGPQRDRLRGARRRAGLATLGRARRHPRQAVRRVTPMEMKITFPGNLKVDAAYKGFTVETDQPMSGGGDGSAPAPFDLFLASLGTCAGIFMLAFMKQRGIDPAGSGITMTTEADPTEGHDRAHRLRSAAARRASPRSTSRPSCGRWTSAP